MNTTTIVLKLDNWLYNLPRLPCWGVKSPAADRAQLRAVGVWYVT